MRTNAISRISLLFAAVLSLLPGMVQAAPPAPGEKPHEFSGVGGLNVSLTTGGFRFAVPTEPAAEKIRVPKHAVIVADSFAACAVLQNRSRDGITFDFPNAGAAERKFKFRVFDSEGEQVWESDADVVSPEVVTTETLLRGARWKRVIRIPLVIDGTPLPPGAYSLQATLEADKQPGAAVPFEVVEPPKPDPTVENTGIAGKVVVVDGDVESPAAGATVLVQQIIPQGVRLDHPPFNWSGHTDDAGAFKTKTPPGRYKVVAKYFRAGQVREGVDAPTNTVLTAVAEVTVEAGVFSEVVLKLKAPVPPPPPPPPTEQGIAGKVLLVNGEVESPAAGASVLVQQIVPDGGQLAHRPFTWEGKTDAEGGFKVRTPPGRYKVVARLQVPPTHEAANALVGTVLTATAEVGVEAGHFSEVVLKLSAPPPPPPPTEQGIVGKVLLVHGDVESPAAGASVLVQQIVPDGVQLAHRPFTWEGKTNAEGGFKVRTPAGRFKVVAHLRLPAVQDGANALVGTVLTATAEVGVEAGHFSEVVLKLNAPPPPPPPTEQGISGLVLIGPLAPVEIEGQPNEGPLAGAHVVIEQVPAEVENGIAPAHVFRWQGVTNAEGRFKVRTPVGKFRVVARRVIQTTLDGSSATETVSVEAGAVSAVTLHIDSGIR